MDKLIKALQYITADTKLRNSANLKNKYLEIEDPEVALTLADAFFEKSETYKPDIFAAGLTLGRTAKEKTVYRIETREHFIYFIGSEADILRKLQAAIDETKEAEID